MKLLGQIEKYTNTGKVLLKGKELPALYSRVAASNGLQVGKVHDIIGPENSPYIVVKLSKGVGKDKIKGDQLFIMPRAEKKGEKTKGRYKKGRRGFVGNNGGVRRKLS